MAGLERSYLRDLVKDGAFDREAMRGLLAAMRAESSPVAPRLLGILGKDHLEAKLGTGGKSFRYRKVAAATRAGLPFVVEAAFRIVPEDDYLLRGLHIGLNWSVPLGDPLQDLLSCARRPWGRRPGGARWRAAH
jgi:hypothetical protein